MSSTPKQDALRNLQEKCYKNPFPGTDVSPEIKRTSEFGNKVGASIFWNDQLDDMQTRRRAKIRRNRQLSNNSQDINQYKSRIDPTYKSKDENPIFGQHNLVNISWKIFSVANKFVNSIMGMIMSSRSEAVIKSMSKSASAEKEATRRKMMIDFHIKDMFKGNEVMANIASIGAAEQIVGNVSIENKEDVDIYIDMDYKSALEIGMELLIDHNMRRNKYFEEVEPQVVKDLIDTRQAYSVLDFDRNDRIKMRYGDPEYYVAPATNHPTNEYTEYDGEVKLVSITELRDMISDSPDYKSAMDIETVLFEIAQKSSEQNGNPTFAWRYSDISDGLGTGTFGWNDYRVVILDFSYHTVDSYVWRFRHKDDGDVRIDSWPMKDKEIPEGTVNDYLQDDDKTIYEGIFVPAINKTLNWHRQNNICREVKHTGFSAEPTKRHIYCHPGKQYGVSLSFIDGIEHLLHSMHEASLHLRKVISEHFPSGVYYDWDSLLGITMNGKQVKPKHTLAVAKAKGLYPGLMRDEDGRTMRIPVQEINTNLRNEIDTFMVLIAGYINQVREVSGINDGLDGSVQNSNALVGIQRMKRVAATQILKDLFNSYTQLFFKRMVEAMRDMIQTQIYHGMCEEENKEVVGEALYNLMKFDADKSWPVIGIHVDSMPEEDQLAFMERIIEIGLKSGDAQVEDILDAKGVTNVKRLAQRIRYRGEKRRERERQEKMEMYQAETEKNIKSAQASSQARAEEYKQRRKADMEFETHKSKRRIEEMREEGIVDIANELRKLEKEGIIDLQKIDRANEVQDEGDKGGSNVARRPATFPTSPKKSTTPRVNE